MPGCFPAVRSIVLAILACCGGLLLTAPLAAAPRPNILWISCEDFSPDLGCYGDTYAYTPNIDRLASQGAKFTRCFTHAPVCAPSRSGLITGMYPTTIGTHHMRCQGVPPAYVKCFTEYLRAAGYYCTNDSKTDYNFAAPVTAWDESRSGAHWRNRADKNQPFFAVINLTITHESQVRQPEERYQRLRASLPEAARHDPAKAKLPAYYPDDPVFRQDWARYYDIGSAMDRRVGQILRQLEEDGLADSTIVFFWGDHGRGLSRGKRWVYDSGIRCPLIVRWPGKIEPGSVRDDLVCFLDFAPTVLALAGVEIPSHLQGQVFLGDKQAPPREYVFAARDRMDETYDMIRAVRDKRYKYIRNYRPELPYAQPIAYMDEMPMMRQWRKLAAEGKLRGAPALFFAQTKPVEELYDTENDPDEVVNLADKPEHQETLRRLRAAHEKWVKETGDLGFVPEAVHDERFRPGGQWSVTEAPTITFADGKATLASATEGASIAYRLNPPPRAEDDAKNVRWLLYHEPVDVKPGDVIVTKACRLGFRDSRVTRATVP